MLTALGLTLLVTTLPLLQRIFDTVDLDGDQWRVCLIVVAAYFVLAEIGKLLLQSLRARRQSDVPSSTPSTREVRVILADFGSGQFFWSMVWFTLFFIWIWLLFIIFGDIFRSPDLSGWGKALWSIFIIFVPYLGIFVYLIARGHKMQEHAVQQAQQQDAAMRQYVQSVTTTGGAADEIARLAELRDKGAISDAEFEQAKAKALQ